MQSEKLLEKYLIGQCTNDQMKEIEEWILSSNNPDKVDAFLRQLWERSSQPSHVFSPDTKNEILANLLQQIKDETPKSKPQKRRILTIAKTLQKVAAILFLPLLISSIIYLYHPSKENTVVQFTSTYAPAGKQATVVLPDGTEIVLNSNTHLKYASNFGEKNRNVILNGEAFFDVEKGDIPFIVSTPHLNVKVLGTEFNVSAYENDDHVTTTLEEGSIELINEKLNITKKLKPGFQATMHTKSSKLEINAVNVKKYSAWKEGKLLFVNEPLHQIKLKLERKFNVEIILSKELSKEKYKYTAEFENETLQEIFEALNFIIPIKYNRIDNKVYLTEK